MLYYFRILRHSNRWMAPSKQYYFCILREPVIPMPYDLRIVEP